MIYHQLEQAFGLQKARHYADAQEAGLRLIRELCTAHGIDADLEDRSAILWTADQDYVQKIEAEAHCCMRLGLPASLLEPAALLFGDLASLRFTDQAQFDPTKFVAALARTVPGEGSHVFENSRVIEWEPDRIATDQGEINARHVVMASHLPLGQIGLYYSVAAPQAEPVVVAPIGNDAPLDMYINAEEPARSIRTHRGADGQLYVIAAGEAFRPGESKRQEQAFAGLESWLGDHFNVGAVRWRWVNEDYQASDKVPFVGWSSSFHDGYLIATGFGSWGLTNGAAAAMMLTELALGAGHKWLGLFDASRLKAMATGSFATENLKTARHLIGDRLTGKSSNCDTLKAGEAGLIKKDGENIAAYRDEEDRLHMVSAVCTHMGCLVGWNAADRTWDCPCHGSRFGVDGSVLHGPAVAPLKPAS